MKDKILAFCLAGLMIFGLCSCGKSTSKTDGQYGYIPENITTRMKGEKGQVFKFKGKRQGKTVTYIMTREGKDTDVNHIPDKIFAPLLADRKKGAANEALITLLNYQYTTPEWSAYYFHNTLFAFSDAVLNGKVNTFQIKRKTGKPFFKGTVKLGKNRMPETVTTNIVISENRNHPDRVGNDKVRYDFTYNHNKDISHVKFAEQSDWGEHSSAEIDISYKKNSNIIEKISKTEDNTRFNKNEYIYRPKYDKGLITEMRVYLDTSDKDHRNRQKDTKIMDYYPPEGGRYTGFEGSRNQAVLKNGEVQYNDDGSLRISSRNTITEYEYNKTNIKKLSVTDLSSTDVRTYHFMSV